MSFWLTVKRVIREADIILLVLDSRMPVLSMNKEIEEKVELYGKKMFLVFNKIDLITEKQLNSLKQANEDAFFVSGIKNIGIKNMKKDLFIFAKRNGIKNIKLGVVGYPNVGKSSIINAISKRARAPISSVAGTTKGIQWVKAGKLKFLDSPGVIPFEDKNSKLGILGAKNPEKLKNSYQVAYKLIKMFLEEDKPALEKYYNLKFNDNAEEAFISIGKKRGFLSKGGIVDETKTAINIIRDWQKGKIRIYIN
ncbi:MAG: GTPase [Nanoarchaeota archaeon]